MASLASTDFPGTTRRPVVLATQKNTNLSIINILILLLGPTIIICTHLSYFAKNIKWTAWHYRLMLSHHNMDPAASLSRGLLTRHFWLWGQSAGSARPRGIQHRSGRGSLAVQNCSQIHPILGIVLPDQAFRLPTTGSVISIPSRSHRIVEVQICG